MSHETKEPAEQKKDSPSSQHDEIPPVWSTAAIIEGAGGEPSGEHKSPAKKASHPDKSKPHGEEAESKPKPTDPMASLPEGTLDLNEFKRQYSNESIRDVAIPHLWKSFDPEHYSVWHCEYKYPEDLSLPFMSANLINGMFQRLEKMAKHAFAAVCLFGSSNDSTISGVWIWRGKGLAFELSPDWQVDYESYDWRQLDPAASEQDKQLVDQYLLQEDGDFGPDKKPFNQCKIFK